MSKRVDFLVKKLEFIVKKSWIVHFLSLRALVMPFLLSSRVIYEPNFVRFILASFPDAAANSSLNSGTGCFHVKADLYSFICPLVCPNGSPGRVDLKKKPNRFLVSLYQNQLGFKRKTGLGPATSTLARWSSTTELLSHFRRTSLEVCPVCERRDLNPHIRDTRT